MTFDSSLVSDAFRAFAEETPDHAAAWMTLVQSLSAASALDPKTAERAHLAVLAALERKAASPFTSTPPGLSEHLVKRSFPPCGLDSLRPDMLSRLRCPLPLPFSRKGLARTM